MLVGVVLLVGGFSWWAAGRLLREGGVLYFLDHPNPRSLHQNPTPRTGGLAILGGLVLGLLVMMALQALTSDQGVPGFSDAGSLLWMVILGLILAGISFLDDRQGLSVWSRLGIQTIAASSLVIGLDLDIRTVTFPFIGRWDLGVGAVVVSIIFLIWMTNLYNFMDGMDGFAGGMTVAGGLSLTLLFWLKQAETMALLPLFLAGSSAGFLVHNFPPARIFMGDVGSIPIGFMFGGLILWGGHHGVFDLWVPVIVFSPFVVDASVTLLRRGLNREKIWQPHRSHYYQRIVLLGWGHRRTVIAEYILMGLCAGIALQYQLSVEVLQLAILAGWCVMFVGLIIGVSLAEQRQKYRLT